MVVKNQSMLTFDVNGVRSLVYVVFSLGINLNVLLELVWKLRIFVSKLSKIFAASFSEITLGSWIPLEFGLKVEAFSVNRAFAAVDIAGATVLETLVRIPNF